MKVRDLTNKEKWRDMELADLVLAFTFLTVLVVGFYFIIELLRL